MTERVVALAQRLRSHAEIHNGFVHSERARNRWLLLGCASLATPYAAAIPLIAAAWFMSQLRHLDIIEGGACPISMSGVRYLYVTRPSIPEIVNSVEKLGSIELAEESLLSDMITDSDHHHLFYPTTWYKAPADNGSTIKEDM